MTHNQRPEADDNRIAHHEAGHAAIGRQLHGLPLGGATIVAADGYAGLCWGALFDRRLKLSEDRAPSLCQQLAGQMPSVGEDRSAWADIYMHCFHQIVELCAGTESERLFCEGEPPWFAASDETQAYYFASLITSSPESTVALISACRAEAVALLKASAHIVEAIAAELIIRRTLDGGEIDATIGGAVAARGLEIEHLKRADWRRRERSAAMFMQELTTQSSDHLPGCALAG
jgi:hypothetical protein